MRRVLRSSVATMIALLVGCGQPSDMLDCTGHGTARGGHDEINSGQLEFKQAVAFATGDGHTVIFTDDATLAELLRQSPSPEHEGARAGAMFDRLLVGFRFNRHGQLLEHLTLGNSTSSGTDGSDRGAMTVDTDGCARGDVRRKYNGNAYFAVPLAHPDRRSAEMAVEYGSASSAPIPAASDADPIARWRDAHARLTNLHPVTAVERVRTQCVDPAQATLNEYGIVVGPSISHRGNVFQSTVITEPSNEGEYLVNCYVMQRNDDALEQCWPLDTDCSTAPTYR